MKTVSELYAEYFFQAAVWHFSEVDLLKDSILLYDQNYSLECPSCSLSWQDIHIEHYNKIRKFTFLREEQCIQQCDEKWLDNILAMLH